MKHDEFRDLEPETRASISGGEAWGVEDTEGVYVRVASDFPLSGSWAEVEVCGGAIVTLPVGCLEVLRA
jgi:hypothetical protein